MTMQWPDPPMCCQHGLNTHTRERCQAPQCGCERDAYLALRQVVLQQKAKEEEAPPPADPEVEYRWLLVCRLDGTLEVQLNRAIFGDDDDADLKALREVGGVVGELALAEPAEIDP